MKLLEEKFSKLAELLPEVIIEADLKLNLTYVNSFAFKKFGYSRKDFEKGLNIFQFIFPEEKQQVLENLSSILEGKEVMAQKYRLKKKDGSFFYASVNISPIFKNRDVIGIRGVVHDITEIIIAEQKLKESEKRFRDLANLLPDIIIEADSKFNLTYANSVASEKFGYTRKDFKKGLKIFQFLHPKEKKQVLDYLRNIFNGGKVQPQEFRIRKKDGSFIYTRVNSSPILNEGKIVGIRSVICDITETMLAAQKFKESEEKLRILLENSPDFIFITDKSGIIQYINHLQPGFTIEKVLGMSINNFIHPEYHEMHKKSIEKVFQTGQSEKIVIQATGAYGNYVWYESRLVPIKKDDQIISIMFIATEITEIKKAEQKLKELDNMKRSFLDRAAHEIKTPLTIIYGVIDLLHNLYRNDLSQEIFELVEIGSEGIKRLIKLVDNLLIASRLESKRFKLKPQRNNLVSIIEDCVNNTKYLINKREQTLKLDLPQKLYLWIDGDKIEQIISNLLSNAINYTPVKGNIWIKLKEIEDFIEISIKDTGIGLTKSEIKKLFKKFSSIERGLEEKKDIVLKGTGLGLYISKGIVELYNGKIWAESAGRNKGSIFIVRLPKRILPPF